MDGAWGQYYFKNKKDTSDEVESEELGLKDCNEGLKGLHRLSSISRQASSLVKENSPFNYFEISTSIINGIKEICLEYMYFFNCGKTKILKVDSAETVS